MRILIVEDNRQLRSALAQTLKPVYLVDECGTADEALYLAAISRYAAIILDLGLPDGDGIDLCRDLRLDDVIAPILVLSGRYTENDKISALDAGADDYITKPFSAGELQARLRAVIRRSTIATERLIAAGSLTLNPATRQVSCNGSEISLRRKEFDLLECLMRHPKQVLNRMQLFEQSWDHAGESNTNTVDVHIKYLRDRIDRPFGTHRIRTVHGIGYKFEPEVSQFG